MNVFVSVQDIIEFKKKEYEKLLSKFLFCDNLIIICGGFMQFIADFFIVRKFVVVKDKKQIKNKNILLTYKNISSSITKVCLNIERNFFFDKNISSILINLKLDKMEELLHRQYYEIFFYTLFLKFVKKKNKIVLAESLLLVFNLVNSLGCRDKLFALNAFQSLFFNSIFRIENKIIFNSDIELFLNVIESILLF